MERNEEKQCYLTPEGNLLLEQDLVGGVSHNERASWLKDVEVEFSITKVQEDIYISAVEDIKTGVSKMANWKASSPEGFWLKKLTELYSRLQECLQDCMCQGNIPEWMVRGRTVLIQKDPARGAQASSYRPIACLPMMWKLLT